MCPIVSRVVALALVMGTAGCSGLEVHRVRTASLGASRPGDIIDRDNETNGLVVNLAVAHHVTAFFLDDPVSRKVVTAEADAMLPSAAEVYLVGYHGALFSSRELKVELNPDTTLKHVTFTSEVTVGKDLSDIADALNGLSTSVKDISDATKSTKKDELGAANDELTKEINNLKLKANKSAVENGQQPVYSDK